MIIIAGHATRVNGKVYEFPTSTLIEVLSLLKKDFWYIRHSIDGKHLSQVFVYKKGICKGPLLLPSFPFFSIFRYVSEFFLNVVLLCLTKIIYKKINYIGVDPLNASSGIIVKKTRIIQTSIFYSVDYSKTRFTNKILNDYYIYLDKWSALNSTKTWSVSSRIVTLRKEQGLSDSKNVFIPNAPISVPKTKSKSITTTFVTLGVLDKQLDFIEFFDALLILRKKYKAIKFKIIGNGPLESKLKQIVKDKGLDNTVQFLGYLPHNKALETIQESGIGVALYNGSWSFNYYGDSMKCREFLYFGLPILTTDTHSTADDIKNYKAGEVVKNSTQMHVQAITLILDNYKSYHKNAERLGEKFSGVHQKNLQPLL